MRKETFARRVALKSNCPELEAYILGKADMNSIPNGCFNWTGRRTGLQHKSRPTRKGFEIYWVQDTKAAYIQFNGKMAPVNRHIHVLRESPNRDFRMRKLCPTPYCVNPKHWRVFEKSFGMDDSPHDEGSPTLQFGEWTPQEVEEMLEILLTEHSPKCWTDVINAQLMDSAPPEMIIPVLKRWHKHHLCPD